jgi:hypothetical protein
VAARVRIPLGVRRKLSTMPVIARGFESPIVTTGDHEKPRNTAVICPLYARGMPGMAHKIPENFDH